MKILDIQGNEITNPDLTKGYLRIETIVVKHHNAIPESLAEYKTVEIKDGLFQQEMIKPWQPGKGSWNETEQIKRYIEYTEEELLQQKEQEKQQEEYLKQQEEENKKKAEHQKLIDMLPQRVDDIEEGIAEVGVITADTSININDLMEAIAELGAVVAEIQERQGEFYGEDLL